MGPDACRLVDFRQSRFQGFMLKLFARKPKPAPLRELAPQLTSFQRRSLEYSTVPPAGLPYAVYDQMEQDSMVQTALTVKKLGVLAAGYRIVPADDSPASRRNATFVREQFEEMKGSPRTILHGAMDAFAKGWSVQELLWRADGSRLSLDQVKPKDPAMLGLEVDRFGTVTGLRLEIPGEDPLDLPREKFIVFRNRPSYARPKGRSDLDAAHGHWQAKTALHAAWRKHLERYAMPTVLGRFEAGVSPEDLALFLSDLETLPDRTAVTLPREIEIETLGGQREASTGFIDALDFHNREIARSILGQTLTTDEGRRVGSLALGKVHLQVLLLQLEGLRRELADTVMGEQVIRPLVELNFGDGGIPRFEFQDVPLSAFATGEVR
jgi:phage gp29-like protein